MGGQEVVTASQIRSRDLKEKVASVEGVKLRKAFIWTDCNESKCRGQRREIL